jgi:hypothetical protein
MAIKTLNNQAWHKFHDKRTVARVGNVANIHCVEDAASIIQLLKNRDKTRQLKASGSHWALSDVTVSDEDFIEMNWPGVEDVPRNVGIIDNLLEIISDEFLGYLEQNPPLTPSKMLEDPCIFGKINHTAGIRARDGLHNTNFFVHLKSGTRIYQAYSLLDMMDKNPTILARHLNSKKPIDAEPDSYLHPWAFETLGGAGGQTIFGALTTGTHGGDYFQQPIADSVVAMHLVREDGTHYWLERESMHIDEQMRVQITDDVKLQTAYGNLVADAEFVIKRDNVLFNAVLIGGGRFGVVSSLVLRVVPQYCLQEHRRVDTWEHVKEKLNGSSKHFFYNRVYFVDNDDKTNFEVRFESILKGFPEKKSEYISNRFLQVAINVIPGALDNRICGVTQRWFYPYDGVESKDRQGNLHGRLERGNFSEGVNLSDGYSPPDDPTQSGSSGTFLTRICAHGNFLIGALEETLKEIEKTIANNGVASAGVAAGLFALGLGPEIIALASACAALAIAALIIKKILDELGVNTDFSLADGVDLVIKEFEKRSDLPDVIKILVLRFLFNLLFLTQQNNRDYVALSYAVMDGHDYLDRSCFGNAASIEVFMDADRPDLYCAYVDQILEFEAYQEEEEGRFSIGYVSLRYVSKSQGLMAPAMFENTVVIEVAGIKDIVGSKFFVDNAAAVALHPIYNAVLHWGQENAMTRQDVERTYNPPNSRRLSKWRKALRGFNKNSDGQVFSNVFTRQTGLEPN